MARRRTTTRRTTFRKPVKKKNRPQQAVNNLNINRIDEIPQRTYQPKQLTPKQTRRFLAICAVLLIACVIIGTIIAFNN